MKTPLRCWAEVDLDALGNNLTWIRHRVGPRVKILTVVKADAYGHGLKQIAAHLMQSGTDFFGVANLAEARAIREVGPGWPILMLGPLLPDEMDWAARDEVRPTISSVAEAEAFDRCVQARRRKLPVHVKVDTGMGRLGAAPRDALRLVQAIHRLPAVMLEGIYTHYQSAEDDALVSRRQAGRLRTLLRRLTAAGFRCPLVHANNSAALLHQAQTNFNLVRPGLLVYGILPTGRRLLADRSALASAFRPALAFKCRVGFIKTVPPGVALSYGGAFVTRRTLRVATITAGYGDGYLRSGSGHARVLVGGRRCRVLGRITMDQMLVDVSRVPEVQCGDEAVLIGRQGQEEITATELAGWSRTIPWEVLTAITHRVPRIYRGGHAA